MERRIKPDLYNSVIIGTIVDDGKGLLKSSSSNSNNIRNQLAYWNNNLDINKYLVSAFLMKYPCDAPMK